MMKEYKLKNKERFKKWHREYYQRNKIRIKEKYCQKNLELGQKQLLLGERSLLLRRLPSPLVYVQSPQRRNKL